MDPQEERSLDGDEVHAHVPEKFIKIHFILAYTNI